jgi:5-formyltetrahydrofolate cyclo-ligase
MHARARLTRRGRGCDCDAAPVPSTIPTKADLRARALAARRAMTVAAREVAGSAISRAVLEAPEISTARSVAAYLSFGTEPATQHLVGDLRLRGVRVLVPVLRSDLDLDWTEYGDKTRNAQDTAHWSTPSGPRLGLDAIAGADVVLVPALAVDERGMRLGRGGGSYDRALARVPQARPVFALLYDGECPVAVPVEPHDRPVTAVATPREVLRFA